MMGGSQPGNKTRFRDTAAAQGDSGHGGGRSGVIREIMTMILNTISYFVRDSTNFSRVYMSC